MIFDTDLHTQNLKNVLNQFVSLEEDRIWIGKITSTFVHGELEENPHENSVFFPGQGFSGKIDECLTIVFFLEQKKTDIYRDFVEFYVNRILACTIKKMGAPDLFLGYGYRQGLYVFDGVLKRCCQILHGTLRTRYYGIAAIQLHTPKYLTQGICNSDIPIVGIYDYVKASEMPVEIIIDIFKNISFKILKGIWAFNTPT